MRKLYLAGPMVACNDKKATAWRNEITERLDACYQIVNPMARDHRFDYDPHKHKNLIVEGDKEDIDGCDYIIAYPWKQSTGTSMEMMYAYMTGKKILVLLPELPLWKRIYNFFRPPMFRYYRTLSPWTDYHAFRKFDSINGLVSFLKTEHVLDYELIDWYHNKPSTEHTGEHS